MRKAIGVAVLLTALFQLAGCASQEQSGQVVGGVLGGLLGSQVNGSNTTRAAAVIVGTLAGAAIGGAIGRSMDETDRQKSQLALENNRTSQPSSWRNPDTGNQYTVTPTRTYTASSGEVCREYTTKAVVDGQTEDIHGTACRDADGIWHATN